MRDVVQKAFPLEVAKFEGRTTWMYLDTKALVTCGVGNLIDPVSEAVKLSWLRLDDTPATEEEIRADWWGIKGTPSLALRGARAARSVARLHLADESVDALVAAKRDEFWHHLLAYFPDANDWPADAQMGLLLHAWAVGPHGYRRHWPRMSAALDSRDWLAVSDECVIPKARAERNDAHQRCFMNAAAGADPEALFFPEGIVG